MKMPERPSAAVAKQRGCGDSNGSNGSKQRAPAGGLHGGGVQNV